MTLALCWRRWLVGKALGRGTAEWARLAPGGTRGPQQTRPPREWPAGRGQDWAVSSRPTAAPDGAGTGIEDGRASSPEPQPHDLPQTFPRHTPAGTQTSSLSLPPPLCQRSALKVTLPSLAQGTTSTPARGDWTRLSDPSTGRQSLRVALLFILHSELRGDRDPLT